ncbi:MAG: GGDEF domain-containing protein [Ruminococcus sp.]|nr:GGDEF domain-containing protein [Ruminococcus sp.]
MFDSALYLSYMITEVFCVFFSVGIIVKANKNVGTDMQMRHFKGMVWCFVVYLISDSVWALGQGGIIPFSRAMNKLTSALGLVAVSALTLGWSIFVIYRIGHNNMKFFMLLMVLHHTIMIVDVILVVSSVFTGYLFFIDENNIYQLGNGFTLHLVLIFVQLFGSGIFSFAQSFSNMQVKLKKEYRLPLFFIILPSAAAVLEGILPLVPIVSLGIFMAILLSFLEIQNNEIYSDALTGLNNRRSMEIFLQEKIRAASNEKPFRLYIIDVNDFKQVNDKFGHLVGDNALRLVADSLHNVSDRYRGFCARYGGDEFVLIISEEAGVQEELQAEINVLRESRADLLPQISVCSGHTVCRSAEETVSQLIEKADEQLYILKEQYHAQNKEPE